MVICTAYTLAMESLGYREVSVSIGIDSSCPDAPIKLHGEKRAPLVWSFTDTWFETWAEAISLVRKKYGPIDMEETRKANKRKVL